MAKIPTHRMKSRMIIVLVGMILLGFGTVLYNLFKLQIVQAQTLQDYALEQQLKSTQIGAERGTIYDRNGKALAQSATVWTVCIAPDLVKTDDSKLAIIDGLSKILEADKEFIKSKVEQKGYLYVRVKKKVEKPQADEILQFIRDNNLGNMVFLEEDTRRYYPYGNFASTVLGFTNDDNAGAYGLESHYEKVLAGTPGRVVSLRNNYGVAMPLQYEQEYPAQDGNSLVLTIDETIQHYLEKNLEMAVSEHRVQNRITGIVMDVNTGEILAMATKPDFDPNNPYEILDEATKEMLEEMNTAERAEEYKEARRNAQFAQWRNKAISDPYEPGSVFKIITAASALEVGATNKNLTYYCPGYIDVDGERRHCWIFNSHSGAGQHGQQTLEEAIENSCNPAFVTIGLTMGSTHFANYFSNFGLTALTGIDLPGEAGSIYHANLNRQELASSAFGQSFKVTPLQLITACSAAVNGGELMQPYIVKQIIDSDGNVVSTTEPVVKRQVVSEEVSKEIALYLEQVVVDGSGSHAQVPGYRVGGKTGTSEKLDIKEQKHVLSFFGFAPVDNPQIACLVVIDEPDLVNAYGSTIAAPVVGSVLADVLPYMGIEPTFTTEELETVATKTPYIIDYDIHDAQATLRIAGLKFRVVGEGTKVIRQVPEAGEPVPKDATVVVYTEEIEENELIEVPDVVGMSGAEANRTIMNARLNIALAGDGFEGSVTVVTSQNPLPGEHVAEGTIITVQVANAGEGE